MLPTSTNRALKEWAVIVRALEAGQQLVILRKGGISEVGNEFRIEYPEFLFYSTYEHQKPESLLPAYRPVLERTRQEAPQQDAIRITSFAQVTASFDISNEAQLASLRPFHIWSDEYTLERLHWRPTKPLAALALRVYRLPQAATMPFQRTYRGCTSWINLERELSLAGAQPVVDDTDYAQRVDALQSALSEAGVVAEQRS